MAFLVAMASMAKINIAVKRSIRKIGEIGNFLLTLTNLYNIIYYKVFILFKILNVLELF